MLGKSANTIWRPWGNRRLRRSLPRKSKGQELGLTALGTGPRSARRLSPGGQSVVELSAGVVILVVVGLALLDLVAVVVANVAHDSFVKRAARAAANKGNEAEAQIAVQEVIQSSPRCSLFTFVNAPPAARFHFPQAGLVAVDSTIRVTLPAPLPFVNIARHLTFRARAVEPIVTLPAQDLASAS